MWKGEMMTTLAEKIAVMQAFERGEKIEFRAGGNPWVVTEAPVWSWHNTTYRIAPKHADLVKVLEVLARIADRNGYDVDALIEGYKWSDIIARAEELQK